MIDVENYIYTQIRNAVKTAFPSASTSSTYNDTPDSFPHVSIEETDSYVPTETISTSDREFAANITYTVNIYTNTEHAKSDAKDLAKTINDAFSALGFSRTMKQEMPNIDRTIYRLILRFQATVWKGFDGVEGHYNISAR